MSNLRRRIRSLEAQLTEEDGLIPHTPKWLAHWTDWFNLRIRGEDPPGRIPIDALRILMQADDRKDSDCGEL